MSSIDNLKRLLASGRDDALLRFGLGNAYLQQKDHASAVEHLAAAVAHDSKYSAAWKLLGKAYAENNQTKQAIEAFQRGIEAAEIKGDKQAAKEMQVFLKRLLKQRENDKK